MKFKAKRNPVYDRFIKHCEKNSIELLDDDISFIIKSIGTLTHDINQVRAILYKYYQEFAQGMDDESCSIKKQNSGRRRANLYLLELCD